MYFLLSTSAKTFYPYLTQYQTEISANCGRRILHLYLKLSKFSSYYILQDIGAHSVVTDTTLEGHHLCSTLTIISQRIGPWNWNTEYNSQAGGFLKCLLNNTLVSELIISSSESFLSTVYISAVSPLLSWTLFFCCTHADFLVKIQNSFLMRKICRCIQKKRKTMHLISDFFIMKVL